MNIKTRKLLHELLDLSLDGNERRLHIFFQHWANNEYINITVHYNDANYNSANNGIIYNADIMLMDDNVDKTIKRTISYIKNLQVYESI